MADVPTNDAEEIADAVIKRLAAEGYDAFRPGGYHDVSEIVRRAIVEEIKKVAAPCPDCGKIKCV
jgi:hypothetical protein